MNKEDILALALPVSAEQPSGENLEYSSEFFSLETLTQGTPEQQFGDTIIPGAEPDWTAARKLSTDLLQRSKDLRLAAILAQSLVATEGLPALHPALLLTEELLSKQWPCLHPELEDGDATFRLNALSALNDSESLLKLIRQTAFLPLRGHDPIRILDIENLHSPGQSSNLQLGDLQRHVHAQAEAACRLADTLRDCLACCQRIESAVESHIPVYSSLTGNLQQLLRVVLNHLPDDSPAPATEPAPEHSTGATPDSGAPAVPVSASSVTAISSRADIDRLLDLMCDYLARHEPSNPAPLLLRRAQKVLSMDFLQLMNELNPEGLSHIEQLAGLNR
ncbi:type VI secretion system protein TssA [Chitinilyticum litopenaei]|uniref:type VI secretion system protein TssA n=1 Tax=Chitinilyticum litopenaei TaxID=1121276 RepID=UPI00040E60AE|nr:type VI secretion system protein TssA [Chitinilyticum litopenaei]